MDRAQVLGIPERMPRVALLIESSRFSGRSLLRGIAQYVRQFGPWSFHWEPRGLETAAPDLKRMDVDGVILRDMDPMDHILSRKLPAVVVGHSRKEIPTLANVITDSDTIGQLAAEHLIDCGLRHFAFCGFDDKPWSRIRGRSFAKRLAEGGFQTHFFTQTGRRPPSGWHEERPQIAAWLRDLPKPIGVMACNDDRGEQVIEACKLSGIRVPDEAAVIGVDNDDLVCELSTPPMSSVVVDFEHAGYESARVLHGLMRGEKLAGQKIIVPASRVAERQSTDCVFVDDEHVVKALRFIRSHFRTLIQVNDVAKASGLARRSLEMRFGKYLGRSIHGEIRRVRVSHICGMLLETDEPVSKIALAMGWEDNQHFARYFHRETKMTPLEYKKAHGRGQERGHSCPPKF
jgi:LacI family transcriptional regulator